MPKRNDRPRGPESDVAARVALERERRSWSAAEPARRMTAAGCPIDQSAINKIEQGDPPRRITVDELVAFAQVFGLEIEDLLIPAYAARDAEIRRRFARLSEIYTQVNLLAGVAIDLTDEIARLIRLDPGAGVRALEAEAAFRSSFIELADSLDAVAEDVKAHLRSGGLTQTEPKPLTSELRFQRPSQYVARAAQAAAPPPGGESSTASPRRRTRKEADGKHQQAP